MLYPLKSILYLDDDKNLRFLLQTSLERKRPLCEIKTFAEAEELLAYLSENTADLLILDYNLPDITALELLKIIRAMQSPASQIPSLILSGFVIDHMHIMAEIPHMIGTLKKPFSINGINNDIDRLWRDYHA